MDFLLSAQGYERQVIQRLTAIKACANNAAGYWVLKGAGVLLRRRYYDADPIYQREKTPDWYQQLPLTNRIFAAELALRAKNKNILELGCGGGWLADVALRAQAASYLGVDFAPTAIAFAARRFRAHKQVKFLVGDALDPDLLKMGLPQQFDFCIAHQFAQCFLGEDRIRWLENARSWLAPGSILLLSSLVGVPEGLKSEVSPERRYNRLRNRYFAEAAELLDEIKRTQFTVLNEIIPEEHMRVLILRR